MKELTNIANELGLEWVSKIFYVGLKENIIANLKKIENELTEEDIENATEQAMKFLFYKNEAVLFILEAGKFIEKSESVRLLEKFPKKMLQEVLCFGSKNDSPVRISVIMSEANARRIIVLRNTVLFKEIFQQITMKREESDKVKLIFDQSLEEAIIEKEFINELKQIDKIITDSGILQELEQNIRVFLKQTVKKIVVEKGFVYAKNKL